MASSEGLLQPKKWHSMPFIPPSLSEVRIVLLGKNIPLTNSIRNFILGRSAFETEVPSSEKLHSDRASGRVQERNITIINTHHLYNTQISEEELSQRVEECISLADPHVFLLVLQSETVTHEHHDRVRNMIGTHSPLSRKRSIMITTGEDQGFINECEVKHHRIQNRSAFHKHEVLQLLRKIDTVVKETGGFDLQEKKQSGTQTRPEDHLTGKTTNQEAVMENLDDDNKVSDLRILLLGKCPSDTSSVGNIILGRPALETKHPSKLQSERVTGHVMGRNISIISAPPFFHQTLSQHQLSLYIKECVLMSSPGPHVIILIIQHEDFTEEDKRRMDQIFSHFSDEAHKYTIVVTTKTTEIGTSVDCVETVIEEIISECNNRHLEFSGCSQANLVGKIEALVKVNKGSLSWELFEDANDEVLQKQSQPTWCKLEQEEKPKEHSKTKTRFLQPTVDKIKGFPKKIENITAPKQTPHLKLVLLGMEAVKASLSTLLLGEKYSLLHTENGLCVKQGEVSGHLITLVEMSAFYNTQLSEQEVMLQTLHCVSLCDPGVHAFFIIIPEDPLTDEVKTAIEMFQRIFSSRVNDHTIFIINQQSQKEQVDETLQAVIMQCGGRNIFYSTTDADQLIKSMKKLLDQNSSRQYTMAMYSEAQIETQLQYKREINKLNKNKTQDSSQNPDTLRIVLLGKTGVGKSASGNTILGKEVYKEKLSDQSVTTVCQKETAEVNGRKITVIDTPGLFDTNTDNDETKREIIKCISMAAPGPHVFLIVLNLGQRFTQEERETVKIIKKTFGEKSNMYTIVLFTGGDTLKTQTIKQYIGNAGEWLKSLLIQCGNRYHVFNNTDKFRNSQVLSLLETINSMVKVNGGSCYTNEMFQQVEKTLEEEKEKKLKMKEEKIEREKAELKARHEAEMEKMRLDMQKEKERQDEERRRKEDEFKQKEEQMKREMSEREQQVREDFRIRREEDDLKMKQWMDEINRAREENRKQLEKQQEEDQKRRDQEEEKKRRREEEWKKQQVEEKETFNREKEEMKKNKEEELKKLQKEYEQKAAEEEKRRRNLEEKMKDAEENKKKELQELQLSQQQEWEQRMKKEEEMRREQQKIWERKMASMEEKWLLDQIRKEKQYEWERQKENEKRNQEENERKEKDENDRRRTENEANEKIRNMEEEMKTQREKYEKERKEKAEEDRKEMEHKLQKQQEEFRKEKENEEQKRNEEEKKNLAFIEEQHKKEQEKLKKETEQAARREAEKEFYAQLDEKVKKAKEAGYEEGCTTVESERTTPGRAVDQVINYFFKKEEKQKDD